ncbi:MAG: M20/M25/M40 family metallo-hydrolase [Burkholderiales bacterium]|nr:M20/M25/M40 family metallo-hydrolase [Burkholderiales bacterium]
MSAYKRLFLSTVLASVFALPTWSALAQENFSLDDFIADLNEIVSVDTKTGYEEGVNKVMDILANRFSKAGWHVSEYQCSGRGKVLIATNKPNLEQFDVLLSAHADTVQVVGNAEKYPLTVGEDLIAHGAGVADDKTSLNTVWWIAKSLPQKIKDKLDIGIIVNPGEESGNDCTRAKLDEVGHKSKVALVYEPGRPGNGAVKVRKGSMTLAFDFQGVTAHAGNEPEKGRNAIEAMALAIPQIKAIAQKYPGVTLNADIVSGGTVVNAIADKANVQFDFRFKDDQSRDAVVEEAQQLCDKGFAPDVKCEFHYRKSSALALTPKSEELIKLVDQAVKELNQEPLQWLEVGGSSDGNRLSGAGAAVVCAMGAIGGDLHHPTKEWSDLNSVKPRIELGTKVLELIAENKK